MATTTVTTTAAHDTRILAALTKVLGRTAVQADYKTWLIDKTKILVLESEKADARNTAEAGVTPIGPN
mgnify:CR=1 FL=1